MAFVAGMVGLSFALPCRSIGCLPATGYGGLPQRADTSADRVLDRTIRVRFDGNVDGALPSTFARFSKPWT